MRHFHKESHLVERIGWLRAAVLGANDGIISTASLILGVAAASATKSDILLAGVAGLVAGAMSMAAGEYVSVSSQSDTEQADQIEIGKRRSMSALPPKRTCVSVEWHVCLCANSGHWRNALGEHRLLKRLARRIGVGFERKLHVQIAICLSARRCTLPVGPLGKSARNTTLSGVL